MKYSFFLVLGDLNLFTRLKAEVSGFLFLLTLAGLQFSLPNPAVSSPQVSSMCESAAELAARETGVPIAVLRAISFTETGRSNQGVFGPWPWTVNMEGRGDWFDTRDQAQSYVEKHFLRGARSFDVGCFQINYKWHGQAFSSFQAMFDPVENALYAARFLMELFLEKGNWLDAAGAYHSRTPVYANKYKKRFAKLYSRFSSEPLLPSLPVIAGTQVGSSPPEAVKTAVAKLNGFPLLQGGTTGMASLGSLMPASAGMGSQSFFGGG